MHKEFSDKGATALKEMEGVRLLPYDDQTGETITSWVEGATIGYGHLIPKSEWDLYHEGITKAQADELFNSDIVPFISAVNTSITVDVSQQQFDASVIFAYNIGISGFSNSSAVILINDPTADTDYPDLEAAWKAWNKSQGVVNNGLVNRRNTEWEMYANGVY